MFKFTRHLRFVSKTLHNSTMTAFTLYGARGSTNTDRVRLTLAEGGFTDYKLELLNLQKGEQKVCTNVGICIGIYFTANGSAPEAKLGWTYAQHHRENLTRV